MADFVIRADHYIKEGMLDDWLALARVDAREAVKEPGCRRFDVFVERGRRPMACSSRFTTARRTGTNT